jgi:GNAT superfamily N-acetyltransferase
MIDGMDEGYELVEAAPTIEDYRELRSRSGLSPKSTPQAAGAIAGTWCFVHVVHRPTGQVVAMGRVIGDGGWYFQIADMAVLPEHQRQGLGREVLEHLIQAIHDRAPEDPWITLLADPPGVRLYESMGFRPTPSLGMAISPSAS